MGVSVEPRAMDGILRKIVESGVEIKSGEVK